MNSKLYHDIPAGTRIDFIDGAFPEVRVKVAAPPFACHTMQLDMDEVDRLLAVYEASTQPVADIAEFFVDVHHAQQAGAERAARAFIACAASLAVIAYG